MKPLWTYIAPGVFWCKGCGCLKLVKDGKATRYRTPTREFKRRMTKKAK